MTPEIKKKIQNEAEMRNKKEYYVSLAARDIAIIDFDSAAEFGYALAQGDITHYQLITAIKSDTITHLTEQLRVATEGLHNTDCEYYYHGTDEKHHKPEQCTRCVALEQIKKLGGK